MVDIKTTAIMLKKQQIANTQCVYEINTENQQIIDTYTINRFLTMLSIYLPWFIKFTLSFSRCVQYSNLIGCLKI